MPQISKAVIDANLRVAVFNLLGINNLEGFQKVNARQYGCIIRDDNGVERYVRIGCIVAEEREDISAQELMQAEIDDYNDKQAEKERKAAERAEKAAKDKARREAEKQAKEAKKKEED